MTSVKFFAALALGAMALAPELQAALPVGDEAPCVELSDHFVDGSVSHECLRSREEGKFLLLEFFSVTCSSCLENLPVLTQMSQDLREQSSTRLVSIDRDTELVDAFLAQRRGTLPFPVAFDNTRAAKRAYEVVVTPTIFVVDPQNKIVYEHAGSLDPKDVQQITELVGALPE
jgi:peroxiredoxin